MGNSSVRDRKRPDGLEDASITSSVYSGYADSTSFNPYTYGGKGNTTSRIRTHSLTGNGIDFDSRRLPTVFRYGGKGTDVFISCSFDNWKSKIPMVRSKNDFYTIIELPEGIHEYKYFVDGQWFCDQSKDRVGNSFGTENNKVEVKSSDFEVFEALGIDSTDTGHSDGSHLLKPSCRSSSPVGDYGQIVPPKESVRHNGPPILPSHLLQVILNQEVPSHCEPALLPEPSHVMLNHLYALSIKDGVMVLSTTHRYRKKYITTLLYKPIP